MPCYGAWTSAPLSGHPPLSSHPPIECKRTAPRIETPICTCRAQHLISLSNNNIRAAQWVEYQWNVEWTDSPTRLRIFNPDTGTHPPGMTLPKRAWVRLNRLCTGVGRFRSCLHTWGMASSACECGAEEQTVDHVVSTNVQSINLPMDCMA